MAASHTITKDSQLEIIHFKMQKTREGSFAPRTSKESEEGEKDLNANAIQVSQKTCTSFSAVKTSEYSDACCDIAGRVAKYVDSWQHITNDIWLLRTIQGSTLNLTKFQYKTLYRSNLV